MKNTLKLMALSLLISGGLQAAGTAWKTTDTPSDARAAVAKMVGARTKAKGLKNEQAKLAGDLFKNYLAAGNFDAARAVAEFIKEDKNRLAHYNKLISQLDAARKGRAVAPAPTPSSAPAYMAEEVDVAERLARLRDDWNAATSPELKARIADEIAKLEGDEPTEEEEAGEGDDEEELLSDEERKEALGL
jgi:hypothetical protein